MDQGLVGALLGAAIGGGATCLATFLTIRHESRLSARMLIQNRFTDAYLTVQRYVSSWADHAQWNLNVLRFVGEAEPTMPQVSDIEGARVSLFASDDVARAMTAFGTAVSRYRLAVGSLAEVRTRQGLTAPPIPDLQPALDELREAAQLVVSTAVTVHKTMRRDLLEYIKK